MFFFCMFSAKRWGGRSWGGRDGGSKGVFGLLMELRSGIITRKGEEKGWDKNTTVLYRSLLYWCSSIIMVSMPTHGAQYRLIYLNERLFFFFFFLILQAHPAFYNQVYVNNQGPVVLDKRKKALLKPRTSRRRKFTMMV